MPAKRIIVLGKLAGWDTAYKAILWADVPAGNQIAYRNPKATSSYENITPVELAAIRAGQVTERVVQCVGNSGDSMGSVQSQLQSQWTTYQAEITGTNPWADYGSHWDGAGAWQATTGIPLLSAIDANDDVPGFLVMTPVSAFAANRVHFVLHNGEAATAQGTVLKVRLISVKPGQAAVTGVASGDWTVQRREALTTPPSGTGGVPISLMDTAAPLPGGVTAWCGPLVIPAGGSLTTFQSFVPQADEQKLSTLDSPTAASALSDWAGQVVYRATSVYPARPIVLRPGQTLEVVQNATAGTGNCRILVVFTAG